LKLCNYEYASNIYFAWKIKLADHDIRLFAGGFNMIALNGKILNMLIYHPTLKMTHSI